MPASGYSILLEFYVKIFFLPRQDVNHAVAVRKWCYPTVAAAIVASVAVN